MRLISIKDELPPLEQNVNIHYSTQNENGREYKVGVGYLNQSGEIWVLGERKEPIITHWGYTKKR